MKISKLNLKIQKNNYFLFTILNIFLIIVWYINFQLWGNIFLNFICLIIYGYIVGLWLARILNSIGFKRYQFIFGILSLFFLISFLMAVPIVFYKIAPWYIFGLVFVLNIIFSFLQKQKSILKSCEISLKIKYKKIFYIWLFLIVAGFLILIQSRTGEYIRSPWKTIPNVYIYIWLSILLILGFFVFKKISIKKFVLIFILSSLLMHCFVIFPYKTGFGGDKWRHIGAERSLMQGEVYQPTLFGEGASYVDIGPLKVPEVLIIGNKTSYSNMWGGVIFLSWLTGLDVFWIDLILGALLFSIFLPFLLLELARIFSKKKKFLKIFLLSSICFYPLILYTSITIPKTFGFLLFLFILVYFFKRYLNKKENHFWWFFIFSLLLLYFNYVLYLFIFIEIIILAYLLKHKGKKIFLPLFVVAIIFLILLFPFLDTFQSMSEFEMSKINFQNIISSTSDFFQNIIFANPLFSKVYSFEQDGWLYATKDINLPDSILLKVFNWNNIFGPLIWFFAILGFVFYKKVKNNKLGWIFFWALIISFFNQMIAVYFMQGNHIFTKRLVLFISFLMILPLSWGIFRFYKSKLFAKKEKMVAIFIFLALVSTTVYISGPKFRVVTKDEHKAAQYIWQKLKDKDKPFCVLANTWPLLGLEAISNRKIVTGGFPFYFEYQQPERVQLFYNMNQGPSIKYLEKALDVTGADSCYFMTEKKWLNFNDQQGVLNRLNQIMGQYKKIGQVYIWHYEPKQ